MKFHLTLAAVVATSVALTGCSATEDNAAQTAASASSEAQQTLTLTDNVGEKQLSLPVENVAVTDNRSFEILNDWGVEFSAAPLKLVPPTLRDVINKDSVEFDLGNHKEPNLESLVAADPDVVINGQRFQRYQEDIQKLLGEDVPVLDFEPREGKDLAEELIRHTEALGKVFGHEDDAAQLIADFEAAVERAKAAYDPSQKVMAVNTSGGEIGYIAPGKGRFFGPIFELVGLTPALEVANASDDHEGDDISVEAIAQANPDWILILDRDGAVAFDKEGYVPGEKLVTENAALGGTTANQKKQVVVAPADTYTNENIITYTEVLNAMAEAFEAAK